MAIEAKKGLGQKAVVLSGKEIPDSVIISDLWEEVCDLISFLDFSVGKDTIIVHQFNNSALRFRAYGTYDMWYVEVRLCFLSYQQLYETLIEYFFERYTSVVYDFLRDNMGVDGWACLNLKEEMGNEGIH